MTEEPTSNATETLLSMIAMVETLSALVSATASYRAKLEESGFSPTASEVMAMDFHKQLVVITMDPDRVRAAET